MGAKAPGVFMLMIRDLTTIVDANVPLDGIIIPIAIIIASIQPEDVVLGLLVVRFVPNVRFVSGLALVSRFHADDFPI
jgi:hypothetical protein